MGDQSGPISGCLGLILIFAVGSCVFGGADDESAEPPSVASQGPRISTNAEPASVASQGPHISTHAISEFPIDKEKREKKVKTERPARVGSTILEQAIFDAFPTSPATSKSEKKRASQAADFIGGTINSNGYLCARPIEAQRASSDLYGVGCVTRRDGYGRSNYLVNIRTGDVTEI